MELDCNYPLDALSTFNFDHVIWKNYRPQAPIIFGAKTSALLFLWS